MLLEMALSIRIPVSLVLRGVRLAHPLHVLLVKLEKSLFLSLRTLVWILVLLSSMNSHPSVMIVTPGLILILILIAIVVLDRKHLNVLNSVPIIVEIVLWVQTHVQCA